LRVPTSTRTSAMRSPRCACKIRFQGARPNYQGRLRTATSAVWESSE